MARTCERCERSLPDAAFQKADAGDEYLDERAPERGPDAPYVVKRPQGTCDECIRRYEIRQKPRA